MLDEAMVIKESALRDRSASVNTLRERGHHTKERP